MNVAKVLRAIFGERAAAGPNVVKLPHRVADKVEPKQRTIDVLPHERRRLEEVRRRLVNADPAQRAERKRNG